MPCAIFTISGRVQGVFFRASTRAEAQRLDLRGYAKNLADGSVEVRAIGEASALTELDTWLQRGPPMARVDNVQRVDCTETAQDTPDFRVL